ncbi:MAG: polynucleotide kinase-phosphatase [Chloroflexi bacterium]|nr:polynucleotide kinase-phosphatase [Chloroflexota bacterium]MCI0575170.1 polynucleotide kinase-phosphatase [Chloroflexota bacterium]MCI0647148.1 polynucleotide kinase-phosphatase [Chloroflexota bacterium]MCI0729976.1 polynucleotide kinase-phosphatase [Chloroflexota bacterium]
MNIAIPEFSLVILIGPTGSGKSTFARQHFLPTEVISSDFCRALVADDANDQSATQDAFDLLHTIVAKRLAGKRLTVVDATNVQKEARRPLLELARQYDVLPVAIVLDMPERICRERNATRPDRVNMGPHVIGRHRADLRRSLAHLYREGFNRVFIMKTPEEVAAATLVRERLWTDRRKERGPFDLIGDVHGCFDELVELLEKLGYAVAPDPAALDGLGGYAVTPPPGRKVVFLGDYVDRGPHPAGVLRLVMSLAEAGTAICLPGNHDAKLQKALAGRKVQLSHGLAETVAALEQEPAAFREQVKEFIHKLVSHYLLDGGRLVVAHAGMKEAYQGRASGRVREFALYGETTGETDEFGLPVRLNWAADYRGEAAVVYGHTPVPEPEWLNRTINIDTGCCFGGGLTALRYPELELVSVPARAVYTEPARPFLAERPALTAQQQMDDVLELADVTGKQIIATRLVPQIIVREENSAAALEVMGRFAVNPKWLIYLPPTMAPSPTSQRPDLLEHPVEAFDHYRQEGVSQVVCEEKHMGSRAVLVVCRDEAAARRRFGIVGEGIGVGYTRTGRRFFDDPALEEAFLARVRDAVAAAGLWQELDSEWVCLDAELMPWSAKAQGLLTGQYAAVGAAARAGLGRAVTTLAQAAANGQEAAGLLTRYQERAQLLAQYVDVYRRYCWPVRSLTDLSLAPFHLLASEGAAHVDKDHVWHMETLARLCQADEELLQATPYRVVELADEASVAAGVAWWEELTGRGGEGMVVKPVAFVARGRERWALPAVKCRGREYLRLIYGPEYTIPEQMERLRQRGLRRKQSLAMREFALGVEALERFVAREPLRRVHECVFGVLALESEPVDPRL